MSSVLVPTCESRSSIATARPTNRISFNQPKDDDSSVSFNFGQILIKLASYLYNTLKHCPTNLNTSVTLEGKCLSINMIGWTMTLEDMTNVKQTNTPCCPSFTQLYNDYFATLPHNEKKTFAVQID